MRKNTAYLTVLLSAIAGYCDTVTFLAADNIFSAHVTGNFIIFVYQVINGNDIHSWLRLLAFPVFILSILVAGWVAKKSDNRKYDLLYYQGIILTMTGIAGYILKLAGMLSQEVTFVLAMCFVFALGFQNAFGKIYDKETFGPTTMITGTVNQLSLSLGYVFKHFFKKYKIDTKFIKQLITVTGFLAGCFIGAVAAHYLSLGAAILPGLILVVCYINVNENTEAVNSLAPRENYLDKMNIN